MTVAQSSRTTLADLIPLIEQANLSPIQKRDQISAVKTTARLLGAAPAEIDADPIKLRKWLETIAPQAVGLSRGRWNNIRSLVGKALALARTVLPGRQTARLLPEWKALFTPLSRNRAASLLAMARYFSVRNVRPAEVRLADLETYHQAILNDQLRAKPEQTWDMIVWTWNACRREIAGWPDVENSSIDSARDLRSPVVGLSSFAESDMKSLSAHALRSLIIARKKTGGPASDLGKSDPRFGGGVREHNPSIPAARCAQIAAIRL